MTPPSGRAHWPSEQACAPGHWTPAQPSWHLPSTQTIGAVQVTLSHPLSMQVPAVGSGAALGEQTFPSGQFRQPQAARQAPPSQTWPLPQVIPWQGSTQLPIRQTCPGGQTTPSQPPTQTP